MIDRIKQLILENDMCVLATSRDNKPHCSLMAYLPNQEADVIYMVTRKETHKYKNLQANQQVSLLIDTRAQGRHEGRSAVQALTIAGTCMPVQEPAEKDSVCRQIVNRHPHLKELAEHPDAAVVSIKLDSFLLLDGALKAHHVTI